MKYSILALALSTVLSSTSILAKPKDCKVNINVATASEISECLDGIGEKKAEGIVAYREQKGKFEKMEQLANVSGIGEKTVERNRSKIVIEEAKQETKPTDNKPADKAEAKPADSKPTDPKAKPVDPETKPTEPKPEGK